MHAFVGTEFQGLKKPLQLINRHDLVRWRNQPEPTTRQPSVHLRSGYAIRTRFTVSGEPWESHTATWSWFAHSYRLASASLSRLTPSNTSASPGAAANENRMLDSSGSRA